MDRESDVAECVLTYSTAFDMMCDIGIEESVMKRTVEQWRECNPVVLAGIVNTPQRINDWQDAKADIIELHHKLLYCGDWLKDLEERFEYADRMASMAGRLAISLECMCLDPDKSYNEALQLVSDWHDMINEVNPNVCELSKLFQIETIGHDPVTMIEDELT